MSFQDEHAILVASPAAYETPPATSRWLFESGRRFGIEVTPIGRGQPYPNHRAKVRLVADYLRDHPEYRYVLQVDLRDVIFCGSLREIFQKYRAFGRAIVCSSERDCWPVPSYRTLCPETGTSARFVNSGLIMATAEAWLAAWDRMCQKERDAGGVPPEVGRCGLHIFNDDQAAWTDLYAHGLADIALDSRSEIFQNLCHTDPNLGTANDDFRFEGRRVVNRETGGRPCAIHPAMLRAEVAWRKALKEENIGALADHLEQTLPKDQQEQSAIWLADKIR